MNDRTDLTDLLRGFTILLSLEFVTEIESGVCTLSLLLAESEERGARTIRAEFDGVANLYLRNIGGGLSQLLLILIKDISDRQLDRIQYEVKEMERDSLSFFCRAISAHALN